MRLRLPHVGLILLLASLACGPWRYPEIDLVEVDRHVAVDAGFTMPADARGVFVRDRSSGEVRTTWFRYQLPRQPLLDLHDDLEDDDTVVRAEAADPPEDWPDVATVEFPPPEWWAPTGTVFRRELNADPGVGLPTQGQQWAIDLEQEIVWVWVWSWEGWQFRPDQPVVGD